MYNRLLRFETSQGLLLYKSRLLLCLVIALGARLPITDSLDNSVTASCVQDTVGLSSTTPCSNRGWTVNIFLDMGVNTALPVK